MMTFTKNLSVLALVAFLLSACSGVMDSKQGARQPYLLSPLASSASMAGAGPGLAISVTAVPGLDTDRVLALSPDAALSPYANARWPDHLPEVLSSVMKRSMAASGQFSSVKEATRSSGDDWVLKLEVQQFYGIRSGSGETILR